jgi:hypothetical protein
MESIMGMAGHIQRIAVTDLPDGEDMIIIDLLKLPRAF